jgi:hypothetical protein
VIRIRMTIQLTTNRSRTVQRVSLHYQLPYTLTVSRQVHWGRRAKDVSIDAIALLAHASLGVLSSRADKAVAGQQGQGHAEQQRTIRDQLKLSHWVAIRQCKASTEQEEEVVMLKEEYSTVRSSRQTTGKNPRICKPFQSSSHLACPLLENFTIAAVKQISLEKAHANVF